MEHLPKGRPDTDCRALVCILLALGSTFEVYRIFPSLPIQPARILASFTFLSCIPMAIYSGT